jgi:hypothetical protein
MFSMLAVANNQRSLDQLNNKFHAGAEIPHGDVY